MGSTPEWLGTGLDEAHAHVVLDRGVAVGAAAFDTAYSYALGAAQRMIGSWLAADSTRRSRVALFDKVGVVLRNGGLALDLRPETIRAHAAEGRKRMAVAAVDALDMPPPRCVENRFNLLERDDEGAVLPLCGEHGVEYLAYSPLAGGVLVGKYRPGEPLRPARAARCAPRWPVRSMNAAKPSSIV